MDVRGRDNCQPASSLVAAADHADSPTTLPTAPRAPWGPALSARPHSLATHQRFPCPVIFIVEHVTIPLEQVCEKLPQVVVVRLLKEIQPPHVAQVRGHLLCGDRVGSVGAGGQDARPAGSGARLGPRTGHAECPHLGSSHRAPPLEWLFWCHRSSDTSPLACQPGRDKEQVSMRARHIPREGKALGAVRPRTVPGNSKSSFPGNPLTQGRSGGRTPGTAVPGQPP